MSLYEYGDMGYKLKSAKDNNINLVKDFITKKINENNLNLEQSSQLIGYDYEITKMLLDLGVNINHVDAHSITPPLHNAETYEMFLFLIENGADINIISHYDHYSMLHKTNNVEIAKYLIQHGVDINIKNNRGQTPLYTVTNLDVTKLLIENGADIFAIDNYGQNLLFGNNNIDKLKLLINAGLDIHHKAINGSNLILRHCNQIDVTEYLISLGLDINYSTIRNGYEHYNILFLSIENGFGLHLAKYYIENHNLKLPYSNMYYRMIEHEEKLYLLEHGMYMIPRVMFTFPRTTDDNYLEEINKNKELFNIMINKIKNKKDRIRKLKQFNEDNLTNILTNILNIYIPELINIVSNYLFNYYLDETNEEISDIVKYDYDSNYMFNWEYEMLEISNNEENMEKFCISGSTFRLKFKKPSNKGRFVVHEDDLI